MRLERDDHATGLIRLLSIGLKVPWDPAYCGGKLLEEDAYARNFVEVEAVEAMGWDYIWLGGGHFSKQASMDRRCSCLPR